MIEQLSRTLARPEWYDRKIREAVRLTQPGTFSRNVGDLEIVSARRVPGHLEVLVKAGRGGRSFGFGRDGSVETERIRIVNPPLLVPDPNGTIQRVDVDPDDGTITERRFREDAAEALRLEVERVVKLIGKPGASPRRGTVGSTTTVVRPNASSGTDGVDGSVQRNASSEAFGTIRGGAGTNVQVTFTAIAAPFLSASTTTDEFDSVRHSSFGFDTTSIPDTDDISSATLQLHGTGKEQGLGSGGDEVGIVSHAPAADDNLATGDYAISSFGSTDFATRVSYSGWDTADFNDFVLNASGLAHIDKAGITIFGLMHGWFIDNSFGGTWGSGLESKYNVAYADTAGTVDDPVLTIEHAASGGMIMRRRRGFA